MGCPGPISSMLVGQGMGSQPQAGILEAGTLGEDLLLLWVFELCPSAQSSLVWVGFTSFCLVPLCTFPIHIVRSAVLVLKQEFLCFELSWFGLFCVTLLLVATFFLHQQKQLKG